MENTKPGSENQAKFYGNKHAMQALTSAVQSGRLCHAYLVEGEDGTGKTVFAKLFAAAILCTGSGEKPCGSCAACYKTAHAAHPDLHLYLSDSKKNSFHVKTVREIKESVYTKPNEGDYKVYLLCRADDMTVEAQNALLKMLEEPPEDTVFLLTCRNRQAITETVLSRCVPLVLNPVTKAECCRALLETGKTDEDTAARLAAQFHGNIGLALDALSNESYQKEYERQEKVLAALADGSEYRMLKALAVYEGKKAELYTLLQGMEETVRDALTVKAGGQDFIGAFPELAEQISSRITAAQGIKLMALFSETRNLLDFNANLSLTLLSFSGKIKSITVG